ncbi:MAG: hypothetical protein ACRDP6_03535 [Actinoallomurus sp.]
MPIDKAIIGARLRTERERRGWSRPKLAGYLRACYARELPSNESLVSVIKDWEKGKYSPSDLYKGIYAVVFGMDEDALFGMNASTWPPHDAAVTSVDIGATRLPSMDSPPVDTDDVRSIRETSQELVRLDTLHGGNDVLPLALRAFRNAHQRLSAGTYVPKVEKDLIAATGEAGEVAAWIAYDADQQATSRQIIHEALMLSRQAGDRDMELFELSHMAMLSAYLHRPAEALRVAVSVPDGLVPRVSALFGIRRARALAQLGNVPGTFDALKEARSALAEGINSKDPYWAWWLNDAEVTWHEAMSHAELGDWGASVELFQTSTVQRSASRRAQYNDLVHLLNALVHVQDWREAELILSQVSTRVNDVGSTRTTNLLRRIAGRVVLAGAPSTITDTAEELRRYLGEDPSSRVDQF